MSASKKNQAFEDLHQKLVEALFYLDQKQYLEAQKKFEQVLLVQPENPELLHLIGITAIQLKDFKRAATLLDLSTKLDPNNAKALYNFGLALYELNRWEQAIDNYSKALKINPNHSDALNNRGAALFDMHKIDEAIVDINHSINIGPHNSNQFINLGNCQQIQLDLKSALLSYQKAISLDPENAIAHWGYATTLLHVGRYEEGFREYEWRFKNPRLSHLYEEKLARPRWLGKESLLGKTILIHSEQGFGDSLQFCRYIKKVVNLGATVFLLIEKPLAELMSEIEGISQVLIKGEHSIPDHDYQCPLMSLPHALGTTLTNIPSEFPYLRTEKKKVDEWKKLLGPKIKPRVGIVWSGGLRLNQPAVQMVNLRRNLPLDKFSELRNLNIDFFSLQKGEQAEAELKNLIAEDWQGPKIIDHTKKMNNFSDTAAFIENLDLVISVDTSTAHLAGAIGKPVWIINRHDGCWRWGINKKNSPWYPNATLFRQEEPGGWDLPIAMIKEKLVMEFSV
jgi:tetratricopeptide (TPR) repeat protein